MPRYESDVADCPYTLVMLGGNDSDFDWPAVAETPEDEHECNTPIDRFVDCYARVLDRIIALGSRPHRPEPDTCLRQAVLQVVLRRADPEQLMRFLGTTDSIEHWNEMYNLAVMRVAAERNVPVLDVRSAFLYRRVFDSLFSTDGIHPSVEGHRRMFEFLLPQARRVLA